MSDPDGLARACAEAMWTDDRATAGLGMRLVEVGAGRARISMTVRADMLNGHGICHGGFIFTLADSAMAFAGNTYGERVVAQMCTITFLRPAGLAETLIADAVERARIGRTGLYDVRVSLADGAIVAEFRGQTRSLGEKFFAEKPNDGA